jgi:hypothetical protein
VKELVKMGIANEQGKVIIDKLFEYMVQDVSASGI